MKKHSWLFILVTLFVFACFQNLGRRTEWGYKNHSMIGMLEHVTADGYACGWALNLSAPAITVSAQISIDRPIGQYPQLQQETDIVRADINQRFNTEGLHGFCFELPENYFDNSDHTIHFSVNSLSLHKLKFRLAKPSPIKSVKESGGSNLVLIRHTSDHITPNPLLDQKINPWRDGLIPTQAEGGKEPINLDCSKNGRSILMTYHLYQDEIDLQLQRLFDSGQKKISLVMWHSAVPAASWQPDWNKPCLAIPTRGLVSPQIQINIQQITKKIQSIGFEEIIFRFAPIDIPRYFYSPNSQLEVYSYINPIDQNLSWGTCSPSTRNKMVCDPSTIVPNWNERSYQDNWNVLVNTRRSILQALNPDSCLTSNSPCGGQLTQPRVTFDLALEYGGQWLTSSILQKQNNRETEAAKSFSQLQRDYAARIYKAYTSNFGTHDTIGFSTVPAFINSVATTLDVYDQAGPNKRPFRYGFDTYGNSSQSNTELLLASVEKNMDIIQKELASRNESHKDLYLTETYFNSSEIREILDRRAQQKKQKWLTVIQWPLLFNSQSNNNVQDLAPFNNYQP